MARAVYKHVDSFRKANRISTVGSQAHPRTGGAKEGRTGCIILQSNEIGVNRRCLAQHVGIGVPILQFTLLPPPRVPEVKHTRKGEREAESGSQIRQGRDGAEMACQDHGFPISPSITCVI